MNPQQARARVAETFPQAFNRAKLLEFSRNLLNRFDESKAAQWNATYVSRVGSLTADWEVLAHGHHLRGPSRTGAQRVEHEDEPRRVSAGISAKWPFSPHGERRGFNENVKSNGKMACVYCDSHVHFAVNKPL
jgi:hypothetical protein